MCAGVGKSGSPAPKPITFSPWALSALALASTAKVADGAIAASRSDTRFTGPHAARTTVDFLSVFRGHSGAGRLSAGGCWHPCPVTRRNTDSGVDPARIALP